MICEACHGQTNTIPVCTTCGGTGVAHCCDGDRAEPFINEDIEWWLREYHAAEE